VKVWDAATWQQSLTFTGHKRPAFRVAFGPRRRIASISANEQLILELNVWDADTGREIRTISEGLGSGDAGELGLGIGPRTQLAFSPDGIRLILAASPDTLRIWDTDTGRLLRSLETGPLEVLRSLAVSPDGKRIVTARHNSRERSAELKVWDADSGAAISLENVLGGNEAMVEGITFSPDGLRVAGATNSLILLWEATTGREIMTLKLPFAVGRLLTIAFSPDGKRIAAANSLGVVMVWDARSGQWPADQPQGGERTR
jgi:WD40 repeat protein